MKGPFGFSEDLGKSEMCVCVSFCGQYAWTRVCVLCLDSVISGGGV